MVKQPTLPRAPLNPDVHLSYPTWFLTPSQAKDDSGSGGGTLQSRITCKDAAHQTDPPRIEACRTSRWKGGCLLVTDADQIELRTAGLLSGEPFFLDSFNNRQDLHTLSALRIWSESELRSRYPSLPRDPNLWKLASKEFNRRERQVGKRVNFAALFRSGPPKIQSSVHEDIGELLDLSIFHRICSSRPSELPVLWKWQDGLIREARTTGRVLLPLTHQSRSFLGGSEFDENEIVNYPVQATAANVVLAVQSTLRRVLAARSLSLRALIYLNIYDSLHIDVESPELIPAVRSALSDSVDYVSRKGYWSLLCAQNGRTLPLVFDVKEAA